MKRLILIAAGIVVLFAAYRPLSAERYPFRNYSVDDGLASPVVLTVDMPQPGSAPITQNMLKRYVCLSVSVI